MTNQHVKFASSTTQSAPNATPIGLYPAPSWVPGGTVGIVGGRRKRIGRGVEVQGPRWVCILTPPTLTAHPLIRSAVQLANPSVTDDLHPYLLVFLSLWWWGSVGHDLTIGRILQTHHSRIILSMAARDHTLAQCQYTILTKRLICPPAAVDVAEGLVSATYSPSYHRPIECSHPNSYSQQMFSDYPDDQPPIGYEPMYLLNDQVPHMYSRSFYDKKAQVVAPYQLGPLQ